MVVQGGLLSLQRSAVYYQAQQVSERELHIKRRIDEIYTGFRQRLSWLTRRTRTLARRPDTLVHTMYLLGTACNVCTPHTMLA